MVALYDFIHKLKGWNHFVQRKLQYHRKVLLSSCHLNGHWIHSKTQKIEPPQHAKKAVSDSLGLVGFPIVLVNSVLTLPDGQVKYFEQLNLQKNCEINSAHQKLLGASWNDVWASIC